MFRVDNAIAGVHAKQGCYLCGSPNELVDTEVSIDYEGVLAVCRGCAKDIAQAAGWNLEVDSAEFDKANAALAEVERERNSLERALAEVYKEAQDAVKRHRERNRKAALRAEV